MIVNTENSQYQRLFTKQQTVVLILLGMAFWFCGAMAVRFGSEIGMFGKTGSFFSFLIALPVSWISVLLIIKAAKLKAVQIIPGVSLGLLTATFLDGIVLTWGSQLYGTDDGLIGLGAAWILWGAFTFLACAFIEAWRRGIKLV
ncbi:hypothetical protein ACK1LH_11950 [Metabacillus indicus]|uniref:Uncharacterized protein n=1 Tax=Metabacillus indicus TaxID=246786 RepID=A0A084GZX9_METID|nr:hypothetical protein [Metabacillus indicus]KEZ52891.1 hypothetical protein GS18_0208640 [Metabacillus indicus]